MTETRGNGGGAVICDSTTTSFHYMVVAGGSSNEGPSQSCDAYNFTNDSWSALPDLKSRSSFRRLIAIDGMLIAGDETALEAIDLSAPGLIYKLVHFAVESDFFFIHRPSTERMWP